AIRRARELGISITAGFHAQAENITSHFFLMNWGRVNRRVYRVLWNRIFQYVDCIHYPTQFIRDTFEQAIGHETKGQVISNGVGPLFAPVWEPKPPELADKFVILFTGRYSREKSHALLIRAAARSRHKRSIQLILAGEGPQERHIRLLCRLLRVPKPVLGFVTQEELAHRIRYADLYVHPSEIEIEAIACLEAIRGGLVPVVSDSRRSATRFFALWPENTFRSGNVKDLAARIDYWTENPDRLAECARAYDSYAVRFDREHCMEAMERMLLQTVGKGAESDGEKDAVLH
ncbi:MAG: glycosyltransferase, partial [Oscillospiraceae bacterium]|nr:glycosyltransferase [Oscillospiraceae bacterium]